MVLFGDLSSVAVLGSRREVTLMVSPDRYLESDEDAYRLTERFDVVCHNLGDNSNAGAIVGLVGTS
jgi:HK97 family phage major capsid protein